MRIVNETVYKLAGRRHSSNNKKAQNQSPLLRNRNSTELLICRIVDANKTPTLFLPCPFLPICRLVLISLSIALSG